MRRDAPIVLVAFDLTERLFLCVGAVAKRCYL